MAPKSSRRRRDLSLAEIVATATELLDDVDGSSLTMRRLAEACGVTPMALYNHVEDKETLLTHVVDTVLQPLADFDSSVHDDPRSALIGFGTLMRQLLLDHRGAATTYLRRPILSPNLTIITEHFFEMVDELDLEGATVAETVDAIVLLTMGSIANDLTRPPEIRTKLGETAAAPAAPTMVEHLDEYAHRDGEARYRRTLGWILDAATS